MPDFDVDGIGSAYLYYVSMLGVPDALFWDADIALVIEIAEGKAAYERWLHVETLRVREGARRGK